MQTKEEIIVVMTVVNDDAAVLVKSTDIWL